jgi:hypothetical protein
MRQAAEAAVRPDEQHVSAPRRGQLAVLTACADVMRDLALRKMLEEVILASQRRGIR